MRTSLHLRIAIGAVLTWAIALAQTPAPKPTQGITPATLVLPGPGAPLSAETVEERTTELPGGTSKTDVLITKVFRDADGRMRIEMNIDRPNGESAPMIQILDRPDGFMAILVPEQRMAARFEFPKSGDAGFSVSFLGNPLIRVPGKKSTKTENLGKRTMDGIEYEGERTTTTSDEQPSVIGVEERWEARELGLFGLLKSSGPDEQSTAKLRNVDRRAPDPSLFKIPPDYLVRDVKPDDPPQKQLPIQMQDSALQRNGHRMRAIGRAQFAQDILHVHFDGAAGGAQPVRDVFVRQAACDKGEHLHFALGEDDLRKIFGKPLGHFRRNQPLARMHYANGAQHIGVNHFLEQIAASSGFKRPINVLIAVVAGQCYDARLREFFADHSRGAHAIQIRQLEIHQGDVGSESAMQFHGFAAGGSLGNQFQVIFIGQQRCNPFPHDGMIVHAQNPNHLS